MLSSQIRASQAVFRHVLWKIQQVKQCTAHLGTAYLGTVQRGTLRYGTLGYGTLGLRHTGQQICQAIGELFNPHLCGIETLFCFYHDLL